MSAWQPIATAPKGSGPDGPDDTTHPDYVKPPPLLLACAEGLVVGRYEWYYHAGYGHGAESGVSAWREPLSDEPIQDPTDWQPLPPSPTEGA